MPTVELRFTALPAHVRTARLVAVSLGRRAGLDEEVLDEVRLAVGEAATRAVGRHRVACPAEPVLVRLTDSPASFVAEVVDCAVEPTHEVAESTADVGAADLSVVAEAATSSPDHGDDELPPGVDLAVISGLVDDVTVESGPGGSVVRMAWPVTEHAPNTPSGFGASNAPA
ncbi:MAG TPA: ATP-binding protein [Actinomycetes bacterium]